MTTARNIDYWGIVTRSARIAWSNKFLWFFGFFAASAGGGGGNYGGGGERGFEQVRDFFTSHVEILVGIVMALVLLWLVLLVLSVISKGALVSCIRRADCGETIRFEEGWRAGLKAFWGMLGITFIALIVFLVVSTLCVLAVALPLIGGVPGIAVAIFIGAVLFIPYVVFLFLLAFTIIYAERQYVIRGGGVADALVAGWELTKAHFWQSVLMWLVAFASTMAFFLALMVGLLAVAIPFVLIGIANPVVGLVLGIPIGIVILVLAGSAYSTYDHSLWTLMYGELTSPPPATAGAVPGGAPIVQGGSMEPVVPPLPRHLPGHAPRPEETGTPPGADRTLDTRREAEGDGDDEA